MEIIFAVFFGMLVYFIYNHSIVERNYITQNMLNEMNTTHEFSIGYDANLGSCYVSKERRQGDMLILTKEQLLQLGQEIAKLANKEIV
jgi:hypothetical protein